jgi:UrcA family protein
MSRNFIGLIALSLVGFTLLAGAVAAGPAPRTIKLSYADLDLGTDDGVDALYQRLREAALAACNPSDTIDGRSQVSFEVCKTEALKRAVAQIGNGRLTARLKGKKVAAPTANFAAN